MGVVQVHMKTPQIPLIKNNHRDKREKDCVKLQLNRDPTSDKLDLCEFKMTLHDNGDTEDFMFFVRHFNTTPAASGTLEIYAKVQYLHTLVSGELLCWFHLLSAGVEGTNPLTVKNYYFWVGCLIFPVNQISKKKSAMCSGMRNPHRFKVKRYMSRLIELNKYFALFPGAN